MFCSQCGKELPDGAKFCPGCGMKTTESVANKIIQIAEGPGQEFWITRDHCVKFSFPVCQCIKVRAPFEKNGLDLYDDFARWIGENLTEDNYIAYTFDELYGIMFEEYLRRLEPQFHLAHKILLEYGIDNLSFSEVKRRAQKAIDERIGGIYLKRYFAPKEQVEEMIRSMQEARNVERNSRGHWEGGGFGVKGAIKGSVKAGMMNMATDMVRGIGDSFVDSGDAKKIEKYKIQLLRECKTAPHAQLLKAMWHSVTDVGFYVYHELTSANCIPDAGLITFPDAKAKADNAMLQYQEGIYSKDVAIQKFCDAIAAQPFEDRVTAFRHLYEIDSELKESLLKLGEYLGIKSVIEGSFSLVDEKRKKQGQ